MSPEIIELFNEYSGIIHAGGGYGEVAQVDRDRFIELIRKLPPGNIIVTTAPHHDGGGVLIKPSTEHEPKWHVLAPTVDIEDEVKAPKFDGKIRLNPKRL